MRKSINILALGLLFVFGACSTKDDTTPVTVDSAKLFQNAVKGMEITPGLSDPLSSAFFDTTDGKTFTIKAVAGGATAIVATFTAATDAKNATYTATDKTVYTIILGDNKAVSYQAKDGVKVSGVLRTEGSTPVNPEFTQLFLNEVIDMEVTLNEASPFAPAFFAVTDGKTFTIKAVGNDSPAIVATFVAVTTAKSATYTTSDGKDIYTIILGDNKAVSYQLAGGTKVSGFLREENSTPVIPDVAQLFLDQVKNKEMTPVGGGGESIYAFFDNTVGTTFTTLADGTNPRTTMTFTTATDADNATYTSTDGTVYTIILGADNAISYQATDGAKIDGILRARA